MKSLQELRIYSSAACNTPLLMADLDVEVEAGWVRFPCVAEVDTKGDLINGSVRLTLFSGCDAEFILNDTSKAGKVLIGNPTPDISDNVFPIHCLQNNIYHRALSLAAEAILTSDYCIEYV